VRRGSDDQVHVEVDHAPEAAAGLARAERAVEREQVRDGLAHREAAAGALERGREAVDAMAGLGQHDGRPPAAVAEGLLERLDQAGAVGGAEAESVLDDDEGAVAERGRRRAAEADGALEVDGTYLAGGEEPGAGSPTEPVRVAG
jgi:hypothetical protein